MLNIISKFYNEKHENIAVRILYFFNTLDTYFLVAGIISFIAVSQKEINIIAFIISLLFVLMTVKIADFYPSFFVLSVPILIILGFALNLPVFLFKKLLLINISLFFIIQFFFMGLPDSIVARDIRVAFIKVVNSLFTVAPTTTSFMMSVFFSFYLSFFISAGVACQTIKDYFWLGGAGMMLLVAALIARLMIPNNRFSKFHKPDITKEPIFRRIVILNIDGVRKDIFDALDLPVMNRLAQAGSSHKAGLETVYRALTNPAFASILTGTIPEIHGVRNNNFNQSIKTEGLADIVPTIAYGSMHVKHFCKKYWQTRIVSLPRYSVYKSDDIMLGWLKEDLALRPEIRLFVADFSEADFLAHAYGSKSQQYQEALRRIDQRIGDLLDWMATTGASNDTAVIVCSDHGVAGIDHSYLIAKSEKYVPFFIYGKGIKKGFQIVRPGKIMDICCTVAYLLGIRYPQDARGQVFTEVLEGSDIEAEQELFASRFNEIKYDAEANQYRNLHPEIFHGDLRWWEDCILNFARGKNRSFRVLDIGCGDGFVGERFIAQGVNLNEFVCLDISSNMLKEAKKRLGGYPSFLFLNSFSQVKGKFDIITASSVFHHVADPKKLAGMINSSLLEGGIVIGSHEPNKQVFNNKLFCWAAALYKRFGGSININYEMVRKFNEILRSRYPDAPEVCREEILQVVEYQSPLEQYEKDIQIRSGFLPDEFFKSCFPGYRTVEFQTYSTFYHRPWLSRHRILQYSLHSLFEVLFPGGNLFRFVLQKVKS